MRKVILVIFIVLTYSGILFGQSSDAGYHFKYKGGSYYLVNAEGKKVNKVPYAFATHFSEGLALVSENLKFGYIDTTGTMVIDYQFYDAGPFKEGVAYAFNGQGYGYIDKTGEFIIKPHYSLASSFNKGCARIEVVNQEKEVFGDQYSIYGLINKKNEIIGNQLYSSVSRYEEGGYYEATVKDSVYKITSSGEVLFDSVNKNYNQPSEVSPNDTMPKFPGGEDYLRRFIGKNVRYPESAQYRGFQERVYVSFVVNTKGKVTLITPERFYYAILVQEAMRVIREMPQWQPGIKNGKAVNVSYVVPVNFVLE